jgi:Ulp1 family protease
MCPILLCQVSSENEDYHWHLALICNLPNFIKEDTYRPTIVIMDPKKGEDRSSAILNLKDYLLKEAFTKMEILIKENDFECIHANTTPRQRNDYDCGVFVCCYAQKLSQNPQIFLNKLSGVGHLFGMTGKA